MTETNTLYRRPGMSDKCLTCGHSWHGLPCAVVLNYYETGDARATCKCPGPFKKDKS